MRDPLATVGDRFVIRKGLTALTLAAALVLAALPARAQDRMRMWGTAPLQSPRFEKGGAGVMMGPNPLLTQRRSEHKRPPAPPKIIANLYNFGFEGWLGSPGSVDTLLRTAKSKVEMWYGWEHLDIRQVVAKQDADVQMRTPILYLCAFYPLDLKADERESLRRYVLEGGTLLVNCCGQDAAFASVREEMKAMFPKRPLRLLPLDHPLYRSHFRVERVSWPEDMKSRPRTPGAGPAEDIAEMAGVFGESDSAANLPRLRAVTVGTRAAVIVSLEDMACGWNQWDNRAVKRYSLADSSALGVNLMTYVMAELRFARYLARTHEIEAPTVRPRQQLALVQLVHDGNWDPNPSGVPYLLKELAEKTAIAVKFERRQFEVRNPDLFAYPLLYMTGTWDPNLSDAEVAILRRHLAQGGVLLADSASGRREFDAAFRKLVARILPDSPLRKAPAEHPVFHCFYSVDRLAVNHETEPVPPEVEVAYLEDRPVVLYSPLGLSDGWSQQFSAYARCYTTEDSMKLTANMIVYAMLTVRQSGDQK